MLKKIFSTGYKKSNPVDLPRDSLKKLQVLHKDIILNSNIKTREEAIKIICETMFNNDYITNSDKFYNSVIERDNQITTYLGSNIAIPHPKLEAKSLIKKTAVVILQVPDGVNWLNDNNDKAKLIFGICAIGDEHMDILEKVTELFANKNLLNKLLITNNKQDILNYINNEAQTITNNTNTSDYNHVINDEVVSKLIKIQSISGLHARPCAKIVNIINSLNCDLFIKYNNLQNKIESIADLLSLGIRHGSDIVVIIKGINKQEALFKVEEIIGQENRLK